MTSRPVGHVPPPPAADLRKHAYADDEIGVIGIDTSRSLTSKSGRTNIEQIARVRAALDAMPASLTRMVVSHHPDPPESYDTTELVRRAPLAMSAFADCGVDLLPAGHLHASHAGDTSARYSDLDHAALGVQAVTVTSTRGRGQANALNVIGLEPARFHGAPPRLAQCHSSFRGGGRRALRKSHALAAPGIGLEPPATILGAASSMDEDRTDFCDRWPLAGAG